MQGSTGVFCVVYIRTSHLTKYSYDSFQEFKTMSKSALMRKLIEDQNVFISEFMVIQEFNDWIQRIISYIKDEIQNSIENHLVDSRKRENNFGCMLM